MNEAAIWAGYERLGYNRGWAFAMTPMAWLTTAKTVMVGLNPGGQEGEHDSTDGCWENHDGNAYFTGRWVPESEALYPIQVQVMKIHELLSLGPKDVFAAQFIPFRSQRLADLPRFNEALAFSRELWRWALSQSPANTFICMGGFAARQMAELLKAEYKTPPFPSGWGNTKIYKYVSSSGKVVVGLPHPSRYQLMTMANPENLETAHRSILAAISPVDQEIAIA